MENHSPSYVLTDEDRAVIARWVSKEAVNPDCLDGLIGNPTASTESIFDALDTHTETKVSVGGVEKAVRNRLIADANKTKEKSQPAPHKLSRDTLVQIGTQVLPPDDDPVEWQDYGVCKETDPEKFFPERGESPREAKKVCSVCDVRQECLEYALEKDEKFGVWGGLTERERRRLKNQAV